MMDAELKKNIEAFFTAHEAHMLQDLKALVEIPSVRGEASEHMPFGIGPAMALQKAAALMEKVGLSVKNYDDCVIAGDLTDFPAGLDILAHLDVVPAGKGWSVCEPFAPLEKDGRLYGRGTMDDKGPAVAALYAMACVKSLGVKLKRNVRLILGTDEECGSSDLPHYYGKEPEAPMTFTPDASFPLIHVEKGRFCGEIDGCFLRDERLPYIASADCGVKSNVIPQEGQAVVAGMTASEIAPYLEAAQARTGAEFSAVEEQGALRVSARGVGGHAAYPDAANNTLTALLDLLASLPCAPSEGFEKTKALHRLFPHGDFAGRALGIAMKDEICGPLTSSADVLHIDETSIYLCFDSRCPTCSTEENTHRAAEKRIRESGLTLRETKMVLPHCVDADSEFVHTLLRAYENWTGKPGKAEATGGGTYVHDLKNGVAFGCEMPGLDNHIHGADEFITIEQLILSAKIFTQAIIDLCA